jgi:type 1 fimbria pilin
MKIHLDKKSAGRGVVITSAILLMVSAFAPGYAWASCSITSGAHQIVSFPINEPLFIPLDTPSGTLVKSITSSAETKSFRCSSIGDAYGIKSLTGEVATNKIIPFGSSGLGYTLSSGGGEDPIYPTYITNPYIQISTSNPFELKIYKIGPINPSVKIPAGEFASFLATANLEIYTASLASDIVFAVASCELSVPSVDMGEYIVSDFDGIGSTTKDIGFSVGLRNCSAGINKVTYKITPTQGWLNAPEAVMALDAGSVEGVGIQIKREGMPIKTDVVNELLPPAGISDDYYFTAAYYKTAKHIGVGHANSSLTIEISYL